MKQTLQILANISTTGFENLYCYHCTYLSAHPNVACQLFCTSAGEPTILVVEKQGAKRCDRCMQAWTVGCIIPETKEEKHGQIPTSN